MCGDAQYVDPDIVVRIKKVASIFDAAQKPGDAGPYVVVDEV